MIILFGVIDRVYDLQDVDDTIVRNFSIETHHQGAKGPYKLWYRCALWGNDMEMSEGDKVAVMGYAKPYSYFNRDGVCKSRINVRVSKIVVGWN